MNSKRVRVKFGDVFTIPIDDDHIALGQIIDWYVGNGAYYLTVYDNLLSTTLPSQEDIALIVSGPIAMLVLALDEKLCNGDWLIVGHGEVPPNVLPAYKTSRLRGGELQCWVEDYSGKRTRRVRSDECARLSNQKISSASRVQSAVQAFFGVGTWKPVYESMLYGAHPTTLEMFGPGESAVD